MDVGQSSVRQAVDELAVAVDPSAIEQFGLLAVADGFHADVEALLGRWIEDSHADGLAGFTIKHPVIIFSSSDVDAIDSLDNAPGCDTGLLNVKGAALDDLLDAQAVTLISIIEEKAQGRGLKRGSIGIVSGTRVGAVQLTEHLAQHIAEVVIIIDIRQETLVILTIAFPVHAVDILDIEFILDLLPDVVENVLTFLIGAVVEISLISDWFGLALGQVNLFDAATSAQEEVLAVLICLHASITHILKHDFGLLLTQVVFPQVHTALKGSLIIQRITTFREHIISQTGRVDRQADNPIATILQIKLQRRHGRLFVGCGFFLFIVFLLFRFVRLGFVGLFFLFLLGLF